MIVKPFQSTIPYKKPTASPYLEHLKNPLKNINYSHTNRTGSHQEARESIAFDEVEKESSSFKVLKTHADSNDYESSLSARSSASDIDFVLAHSDELEGLQDMTFMDDSETSYSAPRLSGHRTRKERTIISPPMVTEEHNSISKKQSNLTNSILFSDHQLLFKPSSKGLQNPFTASPHRDSTTSALHRGGAYLESSSHESVTPGFHSSSNKFVDRVGAVHEDCCLTMADINDLRAYGTLSPQLWAVTRGLYIILFMYFEVLGDDAMTFFDTTENAELSSNVKPESVGKKYDVSKLWAVVKQQRRANKLTAETVFDGYSWPLLRQIFGQPRQLLLAMNRQIPMDTLFRRYFPDEGISLLQNVLGGGLFRPESVHRSVAGVKVCKWVRGMTALIWERKQIDSGIPISFKDILGESETSGTRDAKDWMGVPFSPDALSSAISDDVSVANSWAQMPRNALRPKQKYLACGVDGLEVSYSTFKVALSLCGILDRLDVVHVYSDGAAMSIRQYRDAVSVSADSELRHPSFAKAKEITPGAIKSMYETELELENRKLAESSALQSTSLQRRVVCIPRSSGNVVADEIISHVNESRCDLLVLGFEQIGSSVSIVSVSTPTVRPSTTSAVENRQRRPFIASDQNDRVLPISAFSSTRGDRFKLNLADLKRVKCSIMIVKPSIHKNATMPADMPEGERAEADAGCRRMKWVVGVAVDLCSAFGRPQSSSQTAVELALSLAKPGDLLYLVHFVPFSSSSDRAARRQREAATAMAKSYVDIFGLKVQLHSLQGEVSLADRLAALVTELEADYLVLGSGTSMGDNLTGSLDRDRGPLTKTSQSSLADTFLCSATCKVSVVIAKSDVRSFGLSKTAPL